MVMDTITAKKNPRRIWTDLEITKDMFINHSYSFHPSFILNQFVKKTMEQRDLRYNMWFFIFIFTKPWRKKTYIKEHLQLLTKTQREHYGYICLWNDVFTTFKNLWETPTEKCVKSMISCLRYDTCMHVPVFGKKYKIVPHFFSMGM